MRQKFRESLKDTMAGSQAPEPEALEGNSTDPHSMSTPQILKSHHQHLAVYARLFMEEGEEMCMGEDQAAPLVTEALQKIHLTSHIICMADMLPADAIQQLEVALLGTLALQVIKLLAGGLASVFTSVMPAQPCPKAYTLTPPVPPATSVLVVGLSSTSQGPASTYASDISALLETDVAKISVDLPSQCIIPTLVESSIIR